MEIKGTRSYIRVKMDDGKVVKIQGELLMNGFIAYSDTIKEWEIPQGVSIDEETKNDIIQKVTNEAKKSRHMFIEFE